MPSETVYGYLSANYINFPSTGRIYRKSDRVDITPSCVSDIDYLDTLSLCDVDIVIPPQDPITLIISVVLTVATTLLLTPKIPNAASRNIPEASPNNGLSARTNEPRLGARRPSIFGTVNSVPDLLAQGYSVFDEAGREIEFGYMFVSEGTITASIFKDADTQLKYITGSSAELYHPGTSPFNSSPVITVGNPITEPFISPRKSSSINGQTLRPPNKIEVTDQIRLLASNQLIFQTADDLTDKYDIGETLYLTHSIVGGTKYGHIGTINGNDIVFDNVTIATLPAYFLVGAQLYAENDAYTDHSIVTITAITGFVTSVPDGGGEGGTIDTNHVRIDLSVPLQAFTPPLIISDDGQGNETSTPTDLFVIVGPTLTNLGDNLIIESVIDNKITVESPGWDVTLDEVYAERTISVEGPRWTDYVVLDDPNLEGFFANLVAANGIYKDNGKTQTRSIVECTLGITPIDEDDNAIGVEVLHIITMRGSATVRDSVNATLRGEFLGRCLVRMHRSSEKDTDFNGQVVDDVKWRDLYSFQAIGTHDIANNTRVRTATLATEGALSLKQRKLTLPDATRNLPRYENGAFTTELYPTKNVADSLVAITIDKYIGRRTLDELNVSQIYETADAIKNYFNNPSAADFSYTLDSSNLTFEDTFAMFAQSVFCRAYRRSTQFNLSFEKEQATSTLLFNHRNKIPGSETRHIQLKVAKNADGATCKWVDGGGIERIVLVPNDNIVSPIEVELLGLNELQATKHAWRAWNKARYQNIFTQFDAASEAALSVLDQRILVADSTTSNTYDGDVLEQTGLNLVLSQDVPKCGWIHLQLPNATIQAIQYTRQAVNNITLSNVLLTELSTSAQNYARARYLISESSSEEQAFLLLERTGDKQFNMKLGNYDKRFYAMDQIQI